MKENSWWWNQLVQGFEAIQVRPASTPGWQRYSHPFTGEKFPKSARTSSGYGHAAQAATETSKARAARGAQSSHADAQQAFELPRVQDMWGQSICRKLLEQSPLIVCEIEIEGGGKDPQRHRFLAKCTASSRDGQVWPHHWDLEILAAPLEVLKFQMNSQVMRCRQHGWPGRVDLGGPQREILDIAQCLHPSARMTKVFWDNILSGTWSKVAQEFVTMTLTTWTLEVWQNPLMRDSFQEVLETFRVEAGQSGFLAKAWRVDKRSDVEKLTAEERWASGRDFFSAQVQEESLRSKHRKKADHIRPPRIFKVVTEARKDKFCVLFVLGS